MLFVSSFMNIFTTLSSEQTANSLDIVKITHVCASVRRIKLTMNTLQPNPYLRHAAVSDLTPFYTRKSLLQPKESSKALLIGQDGTAS